MNYIANKKIRTAGTREDKKTQSFEPGDVIPSDTYSEATFAAWLRKGIIRHEGDEAPERDEEAGPAVQHNDEEVVPGKSRQSAPKPAKGK